MLKTQLVLLLTAALIAGLLGTPFSTYAQTGNTETVARVKADVHKLSLNPDQKVEIRFVDKTKLKGYITSVDQDSFGLSESKTSPNQTIEYAEVTEVKKSSDRSSKKALLIIGGVAAGGIVTWAIVKPAVCDGGSQNRGIC